MMSTDSSTSDLTNDWHVINSFASNDESSSIELPNAEESESDVVITNQTEISPSAEEPEVSESQILENEFKNMLHDYAKVVEDKFEKPGQQSDGSSSCSDIEVIEDNVDPNASVSAFDIAVQQISFASSTGFDTEHIIEAEDFPPIDISEIKSELFRRDSSPGLANTRTQIADSGYMSIIEKKKPSDESTKTISIKVLITMLAMSAFAVYINYTTLCKDDLQEMLLQMKHLTETFREENSELREQLLAEMNNKKLYSSLESQITELKDENLKLNQMLQDMILDLQKPQRHAESELLNKEVNKLRDQINVLKFDNEELQKQVAKFRYGGRATRSSADENIDGRKGSKTDVVPDGKSDGKYKSSDVPGDKSDNKDSEPDISTGDVNKLHQELLLEIEKIKQWNEIVEDISKQLHKPETEKVKRWTFQDMRQSFDNIVHDAQKNIADMVNKFQKMNVSDMLAESIKYKNAEAKKVIENIKQYFKMTQEKTLPERINKAWNAMDKEWNGIKKFFGWTKDTSRDKAMHKEHNHENEDNIKNIHDKSSDGENWYFKKKHEASEADINSKNKEKSHDSWMFERAAYRAKERKEDESINWYLKRKKYHERNNLYGQEVTDEDRYQHY